MCDQCAPPGGWTRRRFLAGAATAIAVPVAGIRPAHGAVVVPGMAGEVEVLRRSAWAGDDRPAGPVAAEPDVRFLLVHHTVHANDYAEDDVVGLLRSIHAFHTGSEKGWPDVAYNFVVDRFGRVWETRTGSLDATVAGDATAGNQGFDQKCAFLGDHAEAPPSEAAVRAMTALLAWLADRSGIDTAPGATATFTSRGSNRHPEGTTVETPTIAGHRAMSYTTCPGDAGFAVVRDRLPAAVTAWRTGAPPPTSAPPPTTAVPAPASSSTNPPTTAPPAPTSSAAPTSSPGLAAAPSTAPQDDLPLSLPALGVLGAAAVVVGGVLARRSAQG